MKTINLIATIAFSFVLAIVIYSCASSNQISNEKSGAVLWGENCMRCHSAPSPTDFSDNQWKTIGLHMQVRANLTQGETEKIVEFLKSAN